jgi:hypothetical protein
VLSVGIDDAPPDEQAAAAHAPLDDRAQERNSRPPIFPDSLIWSFNSLFGSEFSLFSCLGNYGGKQLNFRVEA